MKKNLIPFVLLVLVFIAGCCDCKEEQTNNEMNTVANALLPTEVLLKHNLSLDRQTGGQDWNGGFDMRKFIDQVFSDVMTGKIKSFDPDYVPFKFEEADVDLVKRRAGASVDTVMVEDAETGEFILQVHESELKKEELKILHFTESWSFNKEQFRLNKEVVEIDLVREFQRSIGDNEFSTEMAKVCAFHFNNPEVNIQSEDVDNKVLLAENIKYEFDLDVFEGWVTGLDQEVFLELIMEKVREDAVEIFDFNDNTIKYTYKEIIDQNDFLTDTIVVLLDENTMEKAERIIQYEFDTDMIGSYVFTEDWYYDPDTYKIVKTVKGIAPVLHYYSEADPDMTDLQKKILFQIWFNYE